MARYICIEGTEGVGKTTQTQKLVDFLRAQGKTVLQTKEPGTQHAPITMELRNFMLNAAYDSQLTKVARELISQTIRSIHMEKVIVPALLDYDFIVQDRGILSGLAYGEACGNDPDLLQTLALIAVPEHFLELGDVYNNVIYLTGDAVKGLAKAKTSKQEFEAGDAIEAKGNSFMEQTARNMDKYSEMFNTTKICVDGKNIDEVFGEILNALDIGDK